jgi:predicted nucleic acid-binding protein
MPRLPGLVPDSLAQAVSIRAGWSERNVTPETGVIDVLCDASVVLKWFHSEGEEEVDEARAILAAHRTGDLAASILDLTLYELGNVLLRALRWPASDVGDQLDDLRGICGTSAPTREELRLAADIGRRNDLTYYDAAYAAVARSRGATLVTADRGLVNAGYGERPGTLVARLGLADTI